MDKLANDKALAEYCGYEWDKDDYSEGIVMIGRDYWNKEKVRIIDEWNPSGDWNQLMEIVDVIESDNKREVYCEKLMECYRVGVRKLGFNYARMIKEQLASTRKQAVYQAVSEYVKQYGGK